MQRSEAINEIAAALSKAQGQIEMAVKDSTNPHFNSRYADLASVFRACREQLAANGLAVTQGVTFDLLTKQVKVTTMLIHTSGQWMSDELPIPVDRPTAHGIGSALTYGKRYGLSAMLGIASDEDDDGNAASEVERRPQATHTDDESDTVRKEINDIRSAIVAAKGTDELTALGELLKDKSQVVQDAVRGFYKARYRVLREEEGMLRTSAEAAKSG